MNNLPIMTAEERLVAQKAAKDTRELKKQNASLNLKTEYLDENYWVELSSKLNVRLPQWFHPGTDIKYLRRTASKLNYDVTEFLQETGFTSLKAFSEANNTWSARALCGLMMETFVNREK